MAEVPFLSSAAKHHDNFSAFISHNYSIFFFNFDTVLSAQNWLAKVQNTSAKTTGARLHMFSFMCQDCIHSSDQEEPSLQSLLGN